MKLLIMMHARVDHKPEHQKGRVSIGSQEVNKSHAWHQQFGDCNAGIRRASIRLAKNYWK